MTGPGRIALIAGRGALPGIVAAALDDPLIAALDGFVPDGIVPHLTFRIERLVPMMDHLVRQNVDRVIFVGGVHRPRLDPALFDPATAQLVPRLLSALGSGDDAALRSVIGIFEDFGFEVVGPDQAVPGLVPGPGILAGRISTADEHDADRAARIVAALGALDVGQGAVVAQGMCLAIETLPGTDAMLDFVAGMPVALRPDPRGARGLLYKAPKAGQDLRVDLPSIGPETVTRATAAGLGGIAWAAGGVMLIDAAATRAAAERAGLFLWSRAP